MAASISETPAKKLKKRASAADLAPTPAPTPDGVTETAKKRKKKHADAALNGDHADATPVKTHRKEKKVEKGQAVQDLELVVTPVDDATSKKEKKKGKRKSEVVPAEGSAPAEDLPAAGTSPEKKRKRKSEIAATATDVSQDTVCSAPLFLYTPHVTTYLIFAFVIPDSNARQREEEA